MVNGIRITWVPAQSQWNKVCPTMKELTPWNAVMPKTFGKKGL